MNIIDLKDEDIVNYKKISMFIITCKCSFKCDKEFGTRICQNSALAHEKPIDFSDEKIVTRYKNNPLTHAVVFGGLEPFDQYDELLKLVTEFRKVTDDDIVIYTGYNEDELDLEPFKQFQNIVIKFGRYKPNDTARFDELLGVKLASSNQYAKMISIE